MQAIGSILQKKESNTKKENKLNNNPVATVLEIDFVLQDYTDLVNPTFNGWYALAIKRLGVRRFMDLASVARAEGRDKAKYMSWLIKRELV